MIMRFPEPVNAEICAARNARKRSANLLYVRRTVFDRRAARSQVRRITDDRVRFRPFGEERVGADDLLVEVIERERLFEDEQAVGVRGFLRLG